AERYRWFCGCRTAPDVDNEPRVRDLDVPRRAAAVASAENATSEDRFVKSSRSFDVGDGQKVCDGKSILRRHLIAFLLDLYLVHGRLLSDVYFMLRSLGPLGLLALAAGKTRGRDQFVERLGKYGHEHDVSSARFVNSRYAPATRSPFQQRQRATLRSPTPPWPVPV